MGFPMLAPVVALVLWSFVMWFWLYATRLPAMKKARVRLDPRQEPGWLQRALPAEVQWKADNYNHLMEQPTLFYAIAVAFSTTGAATPMDLVLAWGYVTLRVVHRFVQATSNVIPVRFTVFSVSTRVLLALTIRMALVIVEA